MCLYNVCATSGNPVAHWPFEGNLQDISGNGYNATGAGPVAYAAAVDGQGLVLNGDVLIDISSFTTMFGSIDSAFTVAIRHKADAYPNGTHMFGRGSTGQGTGSNGFGLGFDTGTGAFQHTTQTGPNGTFHVAPLGSLPAVGDWSESLFVYGNGVVSHYQDGELTVEANFEPPDTTSPQMWIGGFPAWTWGFEGTIDDVRVYAGALTK
jgi:hypothetical protein